MLEHTFKIQPLGEAALVVTYGDIIDQTVNARINALAKALQNRPFAGFVEAVPAYSSLTVFFDPAQTKQKFRDALSGFAVAKTLIEIQIQTLPEAKEIEENLVEIPISFAPEHALDLDRIAEEAELSAEEVISIFLANEYRVYMLGFLPGFPYMGEVDARIAVPRKRVPRTRVPKGSVGIAGRQTGIYPIESPGGWQIIGKTSFSLFEVRGYEFETLAPGSIVKFVKE